jgi:hypothetical protein
MPVCRTCPARAVGRVSGLQLARLVILLSGEACHVVEHVEVASGMTYPPARSAASRAFNLHGVPTSQVPGLRFCGCIYCEYQLCRAFDGRQSTFVDLSRVPCTSASTVEIFADLSRVPGPPAADSTAFLGGKYYL